MGTLSTPTFTPTRAWSIAGSSAASVTRSCGVPSASTSAEWRKNSPTVASSPASIALLFQSWLRLWGLPRWRRSPASASAYHSTSVAAQVTSVGCPARCSVPPPFISESRKIGPTENRRIIWVPASDTRSQVFPPRPSSAAQAVRARGSERLVLISSRVLLWSSSWGGGFGSCFLWADGVDGVKKGSCTSRAPCFRKADWATLITVSLTCLTSMRCRASSFRYCRW
mmetsp:Transcript_84973/g.193777  ORF Transcript_84973/g.193777 Transcript_84973/m.193777 type:complete len:226 (-) Transcript_84973:1318-1995(-)